MNTQEIKNTLRHFTGTTKYHVHQVFPNQKFNITDGIHYLRESCQAYWLLDVIYSYNQKLQKETFQVWTLKLEINDNWIVTCTDGIGKQLIKQQIGYSDFPLDEITIYVKDGIALLPSEN